MLQSLVDQGAWAVPVAGGAVLDQWPSITPPELAGHVQAVALTPTAGSCSCARRPRRSCGGSPDTQVQASSDTSRP
ncbi:DUF721 domain-containing protein [Streptacidiphilus sp. P02-A3a]|nr:DUF721 domain-containing protein [Streptacidiphilus sp. P02-A3a]